jgi:hypothetical protein
LAHRFVSPQSPVHGGELLRKPLACSVSAFKGPSDQADMPEGDVGFRARV